MKKETKTHVTYGIIFLLVIVGLVMHNNYNRDLIRQELGASINDVKDILSSNVKDLDTKITITNELFDSTQKENLKKFTTLTSSISTLQKESDIKIKELSEQLSEVSVTSGSFSGIIDDVIGKVVSVLTDVGKGSGAIIGREGYVVTNEHVIRNAVQAGIKTYDGKIHNVILVGKDTNNDIAVLKIAENKTFSYLRWGNSDELKLGQKVVALGNPLGLDFTATEGIISATNRIADDGKGYIQTDVSLNPGNSGGPLINSKGEIIGIANFKAAGFEGLGFAIPSNRAKEAAEELIAAYEAR